MVKLYTITVTMLGGETRTSHRFPESELEDHKKSVEDCLNDKITYVKIGDMYLSQKVIKMSIIEINTVYESKF